MSEFEFEGEFDTSNDAAVLGDFYGFDEFVPEPDPAEALRLTKEGSGAVTAMYFNDDGSAKELPDGEVALDAYIGQIEQEHAEQAGQVSAFDFADQWGGLAGVGEFDAAAQYQARLEADAREFGEQLVSEVRRVAEGSEFKVSDPDAIQAVAAEVEQARKQWFDAQLARGASINQALQGLGALNVDAAIRVGLEQARFRGMVSTTQMGAWQRGQQERAQLDALTGAPPRRSVYESPSIRRMAERTWGYHDRAEQRKEFFRRWS